MPTSPQRLIPGVAPKVLRRVGRAHSVCQVLDLPSFEEDVLNFGTDLRAIAGRTAERAQGISRAELVLVEVADADGLIRRAQAGTRPAGCQRDGAVPGQPWRGALGNTAQMTDNTEADCRVDREVCRRLGARSLVTVPLRHGNVQLGTIPVTSSQPHAFDHAQVEALSLVGEQILAAAVSLRSNIELREICRRYETALTASEARFRRLFFENPQPMWALDAETHRFLAVNEAAIAKCGYSAEEFAVLSIVALGHDGAHLAMDFQRARTGKTAYKARHRLRDGRVIDVEVTAVAQEFGGRPAVMSIMNDVTERNRLERQLRDGAFRDPLTGAANQAPLLERIAHALSRMGRRSATIGVLVVDLDYFKDANDSLGHIAGDSLFQAAAARFRAGLRPGDTLARLSGDRFGVLLEEVGQVSDSVQTAERLGEAFQSPPAFDGGSLVIGVSIGVASESTPQADAGELLRNAKLAMHAAKAAGRGKVELFVPAMHAKAQERLSLEQDLRGAAERDELVVLFQPVISVASGAIVGCEALVRWDHPTRGRVPPDAFIPLAEESGTITAIDTWVPHAACAHTAEWRAAGLPDLRLAVNVSGRDLGRSELVDRVSAALLETGFPRDHLELEITESSAVAQTAEALDELRALRAAGIAVAIDDFGTGYSSLSKLATFPVDRLKIDRSFVSDIKYQGDDAPLVAAMIALADRLGLQATAEGVETQQQLAVLCRNGCDLLQGYLFSPPIPADHLGELLRGQHAGESGHESPPSVESVELSEPGSTDGPTATISLRYGGANGW